MALSGFSYAQGYFFSQYKATPLFVNPALAGYEKNISFSMNYRLQNQTDISYHTGQFSAILPLYVQGQEKNHIGGIGISAVNDVAGQLNEVKTYGFNLASAYNMKLNQYETQMLTFGLQAGYIQTNIDFGVLDWPSQITYKGFDHSISPGEEYGERMNYVSFNAGALWSYDSRNKRRNASKDYRLYLGMSLAHLNKPDQSLIAGQVNELPILYKTHGGGVFELSEVVRIAPDFLVMMQNQNIQYNLGTSVSYTTTA
jgi:type IX secretion system PorP/SprF family membrane protein